MKLPLIIPLGLAATAVIAQEFGEDFFCAPGFVGKCCTNFPLLPPRRIAARAGDQPDCIDAVPVLNVIDSGAFEYVCVPAAPNFCCPRKFGDFFTECNNGVVPPGPLHL